MLIFAYIQFPGIVENIRAKVFWKEVKGKPFLSEAVLSEAKLRIQPPLYGDIKVLPKISTIEFNKMLAMPLSYHNALWRTAP